MTLCSHPTPKLQMAEKMERFEAMKAVKSKEMEAVMDFLKDKY